MVRKPVTKFSEDHYIAQEFTGIDLDSNWIAGMAAIHARDEGLDVVERVKRRSCRSPNFPVCS